MGASLSAVAKSIYYADLYRLEIQRQLVKKKNKQTNSSRSICLHFPDLFIYLFIYSFVSLSWRYKPPQTELPRIPSLKCRVRTASPKR